MSGKDFANHAGSRPKPRSRNTDGDGSTVDGNDRWPDVLAERFAKAGGAPVAVLNEGISGAKVLTDRMGVNSLARFDRDVLAQSHADSVILMMGINDVGWPGCAIAPRDPEPNADDIIEGYKQLIARAHAHGMKIIAASTTSPSSRASICPTHIWIPAPKPTWPMVLRRMS